MLLDLNRNNILDGVSGGSLTFKQGSGVEEESRLLTMGAKGSAFKSDNSLNVGNNSDPYMSRPSTSVIGVHNSQLAGGSLTYPELDKLKFRLKNSKKPKLAGLKL